MRVAGYIRVSSKAQVDKGESLEAQRQAIESNIESKDWTLVEIYSDEGISGKDMKRREGLKRLLDDAQKGKFDVVIISRITRFGRSTVDTITNMEHLKKYGIKLISLAENIDFDTPMGEMVFTMLAGFAQLENSMRAEQSVAGKTVAANKGRPMGKPPYARIYDRVKNTWSIDERKADIIRKVARDFLKGTSLTKIAKELAMDYSNLYNILANRCGTDWEVNFKSGETVKFEIPAILDEITIKEIRGKLEAQKTFKRADVKSYVLNGFIRCDGCHCAMTGQTQYQRWSYYRHRGEKCGAITYIPVAVIENAVFKTIFENTVDEVGFERAIQNTFPSDKEIKELRDKITHDEKDLRKIEKEIDKLIDTVLAGVFDKAAINKRQKELLKQKEILTENIDINNSKLNNLPNPDLVKKEARVMRRMLQHYFQSEERLQAMTYDEKRRLLHWLFDGQDEEGTPYGVYVREVKKGVYDYFISAKMFAGARFLKGDDIDYWDEELERLVDERIEGYKNKRVNRDY